MTYMEERYGGASVKEMINSANIANKDIEEGFRIVFDNDPYWKGPIFHLEELITFNFILFKFNIWKKVRSGNEFGTGSIYVTAFNTSYFKEYTIPKVLEKRGFNLAF